MTEEERVKKINIIAIAKFKDFLMKLESNEITEDEIVADAYASMITIAVLGFSPKIMGEEAEVRAHQLMDDFEDDPTVVKCKNKDENGNFPLHKIQCQYTDCEKNS